MALLLVLSLVACDPSETDAGASAPESATGPDRQAETGGDDSSSDGAVAVEGPEQVTHLAWVAVEDAGALALVDLDEAAVVEEHSAPGGPHNLVVAEDGTVAAALYGATQLLILRDDDATFVELGDTPHDVKATDGLFVVANELGRRVDLVSHGGEHLTSVPVAAQPHDTAIVPDEPVAWVTMNGTDQLAVINLDTAEVTNYLPTGQSPHNILFAPDGQTLWLTDWQGLVHALTADGELLESFTVGEQAHHLAFTPDSSEVWVTDHHTQTIYIFDVEALELVDEVAVPGRPHHLNITPDGELAAVADHTNGTLVVYDVGTRQQVQAIEVGPGPHGVWTVP